MKTRQQRQATRRYRRERRAFQPHWRFQCAVCLQLAAFEQFGVCPDCVARLRARKHTRKRVAA